MVRTVLLGRIIEKKTGQPQHEYLNEKVMKPLGLDKGILFFPVGRKSDTGSGESFAATENCGWRKKVLCGEVHDDNAYTLNGVAGHAGLFGNMESLLTLTTFLLDQWRHGATHPSYSNETLREFFKRQTWIPESTWALGFDTPAEKGSSAGQYLSRESVGHLGFTGTSFWIDPQKELVVVLLTNRVHPSRENNAIRSFRPLFHNTVCEALSLARK